MKLPFKSLSKTAIYLSGLVLLMVVIAGQKFRDEKVLKQDVVQYYSYLPATFIYGDLTMSYARTSPFWQDKIWGHITPEGAYVQKYTMGLAILYSPFFLAGHATAHLSSAPTDGYSWPYELWIQIGAVFYLFLGLLVLRKLLLRYFSDKVTAVTLLTLVFCTNLFYYSVAQGPMPHVYIFFLFSLFLHLTLKFHETPSYKLAFMLALTGGMIVLVRPNHLLVWMIPVLYGVSREKLNWWKAHWKKILIWPLGVLVAISPQLLYWQYLTGDLVFYTYGKEGFFFDQPALFQAWFSFRKGWLIYSPVMAFALLGLFWVRRFAKDWTIGFIAFFLSSTYVLVSWWCWWYGGSFGQRAFIDLFPVLAFGFAALLTKTTSRSHMWYPALGLILLLGMFNAFQTWQFTKGIIHHDSMTAASYRAGFGKTAVPENFESVLQTPDYDKAILGDR